MHSSKKEIPGFYRDPKTGKFYRESPKGVENTSLKRLKRERENEKNPQINKRPSKILTVMSYLRNREQGPVPTSGLQGVREYYKIRAYSKSTKEDVCLNGDEPKVDHIIRSDIKSVVYVKGGTKSKSIFGLWTTTHPQMKYAVGEVPFLGKTPALKLGFRRCENFVYDLCEAPGNSVACLPNGFKPEFTYIERLWHFNAEVGTVSNKYFHARDAPFFSIASYLTEVETDELSTVPFMAVGSDEYISLYFGDDWRFSRKIKVPGKVYALAFGGTSNIIYSGHSNGNLYINDRRTYEVAGCLRMDVNKCLNDLHYLSQDQLIVTGTSNKLRTVDLKAGKVLANFLGHKHSVKKQPLSVANDLLCANGADNVIRIWHLSGGLPIHEVRPSISGEPIKGWLVGEGRKTHMYYFEGDKKIVYEL